MGFIGYTREENTVRIFLECAEPGGECQYGYAVEALFDGGVELRGINSVLCLKKFYKLVHSLEERAREHGREWQRVFESPESLLEHLAWTRNAREFPAAHPPRPACYNR
jgi:hypothetical protein